jgi:signal transduction histidine kinase
LGSGAAGGGLIVSERLPRELRILSDVARGVAAPSSAEDAVERLCAEIRERFCFDEVRFVGDDAGRDELVLLDAALESGRAVTDAGRVAVPLLDDHSQCVGYLVCDRGPAPPELSDADLHLLSTLGYLGGVLTAKAAQHEQLENALDELRRADDLQREFVSIASHELRAPIAVVCGITATLQRRAAELEPQQIEELRAALYDQSAHLNDLTEQLLDLSRVDAGRIRVDLRPFDLRRAVDALLLRVAPGQEERVAVAIEPGCEGVFDLLAFDRVAGNLLTNALKYAAGTVAVRGDRDGIVVEDRGPGVPPSFVPHLFDRFTRAEGTPRDVSGAGLGLAIARAFARASGGDLSYEPATPTGSRFVFAFRRAGARP